MNLVEGERVYVLEWNNADWWYVRKHLTEETGWVPAQYLKDEETYTMYVQRKLVEKIEKLPVFESKLIFKLMLLLTSKCIVFPLCISFSKAQNDNGNDSTKETNINIFLP